MPTLRPRDPRRGRGRPGARLGAVVAAVGCLAALALALALGGCGGDELADGTAAVDIGKRTTTFELESCGLDGSTIFVVGRSGGGEVLQAVVGLDTDGTTGVPESTGLTVTDEGHELAAFGDESWSRRDGSGPPPGRIASADRRGSRIRASGDLVILDETGPGDPDLGTQQLDFSLDARCDDQTS